MNLVDKTILNVIIELVHNEASLIENMKKMLDSIYIQ